MSTATLPRPAGDFDPWDDYLKFAVLTSFIDLDLPAEGPVREHRPARGADRRAAIERSLRGEV